MKSKTKFSHYTLLADLFDYPASHYKESVIQVQNYLEEEFPELANKLLPFTNFVTESSLHQMEELFTRSFEVQAVTTLDLGYLLFGDDYKRAELLVNLNREHNDVGNDCGNELADHLPNVLRLLPKLHDEVLLKELINHFVAPGLLKIIDDFKPERLQEKNKVYKKHHKTLIEQSSHYGLIYNIPIKVVMDFISADFEIKLVDKTAKESGFLGSLGQEMELEK
jgi:nitrate reductase assembly molybdenum cofactor insertion protein NarJ